MKYENRIATDEIIRFHLNSFYFSHPKIDRLTAATIFYYNFITGVTLAEFLKIVNVPTGTGNKTNE